MIHGGEPRAQRAAAQARVGLPDQVVARLLAAIGAGEHPPGSRLPPEPELAVQVNVSRLTLREAIKILRDKGVLRVEHGRGTFVNPPELWSPLDPALLAGRSMLGDSSEGTFAEQLAEARAVLELGVATLAAQRRTDQDLERLRATVDDMRSGHDSGDLEAYTVADRAFHEDLLLSTRNPLLGAVFEPIWALIDQVRVTTAVDATMREKAIAAHTRILDAVVAADQEAAARAMWAHVAEAHAAAAEDEIPMPPPGSPSSQSRDHRRPRAAGVHTRRVQAG